MRMSDLPEAFVNRMKNALGEESDAFFLSYEKDNIRSLRLNPLKSGNIPFMDKLKVSVEWEKYGRYYDDAIEPGRDALHNAGAYYIQEASAMAPVSYLDPQPGDRVLDLCAAPGGKSTQIAGYMKGEGLLVTNEIMPKRAQILSENVERMGVRNALVISEDPRKLTDRFEGFFNRILVDAPCSGEGMFRKHPEAMEEWSPENVQLCAERQDWILDCAAQMLMAGGRLVYSTCTFAEEEDEGSVSRFLERHPEMKLIGPGMVHMWPHKLEGEGHFLAVLKKINPADESPDDDDVAVPISRSGRNGSKAINGCGKVDSKAVAKCGKPVSKAGNKGGKGPDLSLFSEFVDELILDDITKHYVNQDNRLIFFGTNLYLSPAEMPDIRGLKVLRAGLQLGSFEKNRFEPSHSLALAFAPDIFSNIAEVTERGADMYLRGMTLTEDMLLTNNAVEKGWCIVSYCGYSLGWGKMAGGVIKNHYPKGLRVM